MENRNTALRKAEQIMETLETDSREVLVKMIERDFTEEDCSALEKLNSHYEKGYLTGNEYIARITGILHRRSIAEGKPL
jgi:hypothetical protein